MKCGNRQICLGLAVVAGLSVAVVGCSTHHSADNKAVERRVKAVDTVSDLRTDLKRADYQITATQQSLHRLADQQAGDLKPSYDAFVSDISKNRSINEKIESHSLDLANEASSHINAWDARARTIASDTLRQESLNREQQARDEHQRTMTPLNDLRAAYTQYIRHMEDLASFAANDLTPRGVAGLRDQVGRADQMARDLRNRLAQSDVRLDQLANAWRTDVPLAAGATTMESGQPAGGRVSPADDRDRTTPPSDRTVPPPSDRDPNL